MLSLNKSLFRGVLSELVHRLGLTLRSEKAFTRHASHVLDTPLGVVLAVPAASGCAADEQSGPVQSIKHSCEASERITPALQLLDNSQPRPECESIDIHTRLDALFGECQPLAESRDMTFSCFGQARVTAPPALLDVLLDTLLRNGVGHGEEFVQIRLSDRGLQMLNPVRNSASGQGHDDQGLGIVRRICERCGWQLTHGYRKQAYVVNICFSPPEESL